MWRLPSAPPLVGGASAGVHASTTAARRARRPRRARRQTRERCGGGAHAAHRRRAGCRRCGRRVCPPRCVLVATPFLGGLRSHVVAPPLSAVAAALANRRAGRLVRRDSWLDGRERRRLGQVADDAAAVRSTRSRGERGGIGGGCDSRAGHLPHAHRGRTGHAGLRRGINPRFRQAAERARVFLRRAPPLWGRWRRKRATAAARCARLVSWPLRRRPVAARRGFTCAAAPPRRSSTTCIRGSCCRRCGSCGCTPFTLSGEAMGAIGNQPSTAGPLQTLHQSDTSDGVWNPVVAPLLRHHINTL